MPHPRHFSFVSGFVGVIALLFTQGCVGSNPVSAAPKPAEPSPPPTSKAKPEPTTAPAATSATYKFVKPDHVRGIYLTAWSAGSKKKMEQVYGMFDRTTLNAVVIDVRDSGEMYWKTDIPLAKETGANDIAIVNPKRVFEDLLKHNIYPIARVACFRDNFVPKKYHDRGVQQPDGNVWHDRSGNSWLDPYNKDNWKYIADTVDFALNVGFPEIQLDYVRFASEGKKNSQRFPAKDKYSDPKAKPEDVIAAFCDYIREKVKARGAMLSADIFGIISSSKSDQGIGQELEKVAKPFDCLSPMVYPSHYHAGEYGIKYPNDQPYEILKKSLGDFKKRLPAVVLRPWIQDFTIPVPGQPHRHYGVAEIHAQIKAAHELGYDDYLLWNPSNKYTEAAIVKPKSKA